MWRCSPRPFMASAFLPSPISPKAAVSFFQKIQSYVHGTSEDSETEIIEFLHQGRDKAKVHFKNLDNFIQDNLIQKANPNLHLFLQ